MPAIIRTQSAGTLLDKVLQDVLDTDQTKWKKFYNLNQIKTIFSQLAVHIENHNFFRKDYSINIFFDFLKSFVKDFSITKKKLNKGDLNNLNSILSNCQNFILNQMELNQNQTEIIIQYLNFINIFFQGGSRYWLVEDQIKFTMNDLSKIAIHVAKHNNAPLVNFIYSYVSILKLSFDIEKFMLDYQKNDVAQESIVLVGKILFLKPENKINRIIPHLFSSLAYEYKLITYYKASFNLTKSEVWQKEIITAAMDLQDNFFKHLNKRDDVLKEGLKYYFHKYFIQEAEIASPLRELYANYFAYYANEHFRPLPLTSECPTSNSDQFIIEHAGLSQDKLDIVCQAKACADRNHAQWLQQLEIEQTELPTSRYIYRVFNETRFDDDLNFFTSYEPPSTGFYMSAYRNQSEAKGVAYVQYRSDLTSWWEVSGHEYAHHLNFVAFNNIPRNFNEGLAYRVILSACGDSSYRRWLEANRNNYTSLNDLQRPDFIGYNPSFLYMSYLVDTNPAIFSEILQNYRTHDEFTAEKIKQLSQDPYFFSWISENIDQCRNFTLGKLGEGDNYCPDLLASGLEKKLNPNIFRTTRSIPLPTSTLSSNIGPALLTASKLTPDQMGRELIFKISRNKLTEFITLLKNGANPNFRDENTGNTPLHFLYYYGNCDVQYLELLLKFGAKVTPNLKGEFPLQIAETRCNATQLLKIHEVFTKKADQEKLSITIAIPIASFVNGAISGGCKEIVQRNSESCYLPNIIFYAVKPTTLAMTNSAMNVLLAGSAEAIGLDDIGLSFGYYLLINYVGLMLAQFGERIINKFKNKFLSILMPILLYIFFLNPSLLILLLSEGFTAPSFQVVMQPLLSLLSSGIFFKAGEYTAEKIYGKFFPAKETVSVNSNQDYFLRYSLDGTEKKISVEEKTLQEIKDKLEHLQKVLKKRIEEQAYILSFDESFVAANNNLLILLNGCHENKESYRNIFKTFKENLTNIQKDLNSLLEKIKLKKDKLEIKSLWDEITKILPLVSQIQPLPPLVKQTPDLVANHATRTSIEEEQTVALINSVNEKANHFFASKKSRNTRPPTMLGKIMNTFFRLPLEPESEFPKPPTEEELQEMGVFTKENTRKVNQSGA